MQNTDQPRLSRMQFPLTGQRIRVVTIDGEPWFATRDVCQILDRGNPTRAVSMLRPEESRTVDMRTVSLTSSKPLDETAGQNEYTRGNPLISVVSESGLYSLIMRSRKPGARAFQQWVTAELLPAVRRGDADLDAQRERMGETLVDALDLDEQVVTTISLDGQDFEVRKDGRLRCVHGLMELVSPSPGEEVGPPHDPYYQCPRVERVGIHGSRSFRACRAVHAVEVTRAVVGRAGAPGIPEQRQDESDLSVRMMAASGPADDVIRLFREFWR